jgi:predicted phage terminase large subunit-like protein
MTSGVFYIEHVERIQGTPKTVEDCIKNIASSDGGNVTIVIEEDPGQAGKFESSYYVKALAGYTIKTNPVRENKITRAGPFSSQAEHGNVKIVRGKWNDAYISELESFPTKSSKDDQVDASSGAFKMLTADNIGSFSKDGNLTVSNTRANSLNSKRGW